MVSLGHGLGDDGRSMVSLEPANLREAAVATTGLDDFGDTWWEDPFRRLCASLDGEARLHLPGRIRTRGEIQLILQNRLRMVALWKREPAVLREPVHAPIVVTGLGRSGTTLLHELLACDPDNRPPLLWELLHTVPYEDASGDLCDDEITLMDEMVPAFTAMHENGGRLPTECIFAFAHQFSSDMYTGPLQRGRVHGVAQRPSTRPRFTTGTSAICRRCSGWPSGRRRAGSSRRPPTFPPCLSSSRPTPTHAS